MPVIHVRKKKAKCPSAFTHIQHPHLHLNKKQDLEPLGVVHTTAHETNQLAPADVLQLSRIFHESKVGPRVWWMWCGRIYCG